MAIRFGDAFKSFQEGQDFKQKKQSNAVDALVKEAQLKELGYDVQPGRFGPTLSQNPNFVSTKALERQKLQNQLDPNYEANKAAAKEKAILQTRKEMFGGSGTFGQTEQNSESPFIYDPTTGKDRANPTYLNPLQKEKLNALNKKKQDDLAVQQNRDEQVRQDAQAQLNAIQQSKKGIKYFGPMGNLPTIAAPSSLVGEYGKRKEWENNTNKLLSGRIIDVMNKMKQASKTGATGFGQLNKSELTLIQNASNVLSKDLPPDVAEKYLNELEPIYKKMIGQQPNVSNENVLPEGVTEEDIQYTMEKNNLSREEVLRKLNA